jgi:hypothetical protein
VEREEKKNERREAREKDGRCDNVLMRLGHALKQNQSCFLREHQPKRTIVSDDLRFTDY